MSMLDLITEDKRLTKFNLIKGKRSAKQHTYSEMRQVYELSLQGLTIKQISDQTKIPRPTIHYWIMGESVNYAKAIGIDIENGKRFYNDNEILAAEKLRKKGLRPIDVAKRLKIPYGTIKGWFNGDCQRYQSLIKNLKF